MPTLPQEGKNLDEQFEPELFNLWLNNPRVRVIEPLGFKGRIEPQGEATAIIKGLAKTTIMQQCDRCLKECYREISFGLEMLLKPFIYPSHDIDDVGLHFYRDEFFILDDILCEHLLLSIDTYWAEEDCEGELVQ